MNSDGLTAQSHPLYAVVRCRRGFPYQVWSDNGKRCHGYCENKSRAIREAKELRRWKNPNGTKFWGRVTIRKTSNDPRRATCEQSKNMARSKTLQATRNRVVLHRAVAR